MNRPISYFAKDRLLAKMNAQLAVFEKDPGVSAQMNRNHMYVVIESMSNMTRVQAFKIKRAIDAANERAKLAASKYGWPYSEVSPSDYMAFA